MIRYIAIRLLDAIPTVLLVLSLVFLAMRVLPGDPAIAALGDLATAEQLDAFRDKMGLNEPLWQQYFSFLGNMLTLNFGKSLMNGREVISLIGYNLPYTIELTLASVMMGVAAGVPLGVWAATNANKAARLGHAGLFLDRLCSA